MKILFYLRIVVMGGAERYLLTLLPELKKRNIDVGFFCTLQDNNRDIVDYFVRHFSPYNIPVHTIKASSILSLKAAKKLAEIISTEKYTILNAHLIHAEIISAISKLLFKTSCKLVTTKHGYLQKFMDQNGLDHTKINKLSLSYLIEKYIQNFVSSNFAVSKGLAEFYVFSGICKSSKMEFIYHGMEHNIDKITRSVRYSDNQVLIVARLRRFKGHHLLIETVKILSSEIPDLKLVILGKGEEMNNLIKMVHDFKLEQWVIFEGFTDNVFNYIVGSDLVLAPSLVEPFGLIVLEAYNCAKPVIAFNVTAFNENIIDNETGCLVSPYNVKEFADKVKYLLQNKEVARKLGENGLKLLQNKFSLNSSIDQTIRFYEKTLRTSKRGKRDVPERLV